MNDRNFIFVWRKQTFSHKKCISLLKEPLSQTLSNTITKIFLKIFTKINIITLPVLEKLWLFLEYFETLLNVIVSSFSSFNPVHFDIFIAT